MLFLFTKNTARQVKSTLFAFIVLSIKSILSFLLFYNTKYTIPVLRHRCLVVSNRERHGCRDRAPRDGFTACLTQRQRGRKTLGTVIVLTRIFPFPLPHPLPRKASLY